MRESTLKKEKKIEGGETEIHYYDPLTLEKSGQLAHEDGEKIPGGAVELKVVKSEGNIGEIEPLVNAEGAEDITELEHPETTEEVMEVGGKELIERYFERVLRKFGGDVYRAGKVNEVAIGHRVSLSLDGGYVYAIPASEASHMQQIIDGEVAVLAAQPGVKFSKETGLDRDILAEHGLGFTRKITMNGEEYNIKFLFLKEDGYLGGEKIQKEDKKKQTLMERDLKGLKGANTDVKEPIEKTEDGVDVNEGYFGEGRTFMTTKGASNDDLEKEPKHDLDKLESELTKDEAENEDEENKISANTDLEKTEILKMKKETEEVASDNLLETLNQDVVELKTPDVAFEHNAVVIGVDDDFKSLEENLANNVEKNSNQASTLQNQVQQSNKNLF